MGATRVVDGVQAAARSCNAPGDFTNSSDDCGSESCKLQLACTAHRDHADNQYGPGTLQYSRQRRRFCIAGSRAKEDHT